jgi:chemotaxis protein methyltransferase CheR
MAVDEKETQNIEIDYFLDAIYRQYGYDFRNYSRASLKRRIQYRLGQSGLTYISEMVPKILYDKKFLDDFLNDMSIVVTSMFRDPPVFKAIRERIVPKLKTYPRVNVWHAGCATGEEVYSVAILLQEEGLLSRATIYATDFNKRSLEIGEQGIYPADSVKYYTQNYQLSGGKGSFTDYYQTRYGSIKMKSFLRESIQFAHHNLMHGHRFADMHLVLCRNVLIYFDQSLQNSVLSLLRDSLLDRCFLVLGDKESLEFSEVKEDFEQYDPDMRIYRKRSSIRSSVF